VLLTIVEKPRIARTIWHEQVKWYAGGHSQGTTDDEQHTPWGNSEALVLADAVHQQASDYLGETIH
jgi:hypothetical protein